MDNATGTAGLLAIAKAFVSARKKPERSIVFLSVTLEESGLLGSAYYVDHPLFPLAQTVAAFNMDAMYFGGPTRDVTVVNIGASSSRTIWPKPRRRRAGCSWQSRRRRRATFFRSDHFNFAKRGVPALYIKGGIDDREHGIAWRQKYFADFTAQKYHKVGDEYSPDADLRAGVEDLALLYAVGAKLAAEKTFPNWNPTVNFARRAIAAGRPQPRSLEIVPQRRSRRVRQASRPDLPCVLLYGSQPCGSVVGNRKSPNKVTFMSWLCFRFPRRLELALRRCRARSSAFRSAR